MKIVFVGTGEIGLPSLQALHHSSEHEVILAVTQPDRPAGRKMELKPSCIKEFAQAHGIPIRQPEKINREGLSDELQQMNPDVVIVCAYGQIIGKRLLTIGTFGWLNIHASLLPKHRGASCIQAAILAGDALTGITIMQMNEGLDTGDVLSQSSLEILPFETAGQLHDRLSEIAPELLLNTLSHISQRICHPQSQDHQMASYAPRLQREDGLINWNDSGEKILRHIRAMNPWPTAHTAWILDHHLLSVKIYHASFHTDRLSLPIGHCIIENGSWKVSVGDGHVRLVTVQLPGRKILNAEECVRGITGNRESLILRAG